MTSSYRFTPIGVVHACYREKFGVPRQPGLIRVPGSIEIYPQYARPDAFRGLNEFSHLWVLFVFHQTRRGRWKPTVRPPRLGGNRRVGVFASRSMFRPNAIGLSVVELIGIEKRAAGLQLNIMGGDFIEGTPVLDIKPYIPYADAIPAARSGYAQTPPATRFEVHFSAAALATIADYQASLPDLQATLRAILEYDPRPSYRAETDAKDAEYAMRLYDLDVKWRVQAQSVLVYDISAANA